MFEYMYVNKDGNNIDSAAICLGSPAQLLWLNVSCDSSYLSFIRRFFNKCSVPIPIMATHCTVLVNEDVIKRLIFSLDASPNEKRRLTTQAIIFEGLR